MPGPASVLIIAKKKAAGPGGFFDPMAEHSGMAMGPMMFEMASEGEEDEGDEPTPEMASTVPDLSKMDFKSAAAKLREIAGQLEKSAGMHAQQAKTLRSIVGGEGEGEEEEDTGEEPTPAKAMASAPKKGPPAFLKPKPMKY